MKGQMPKVAREATRTAKPKLYRTTPYFTVCIVMIYG